VLGTLVKMSQQGTSLWWHDGSFIVFTSEFTDAIQVLKPHDGDKLDLSPCFTTQELDAVVTGDPPVSYPHKDLFPEQCLVLARILLGRPSVPDPHDHDNTSSLWLARRQQYPAFEIVFSPIWLATASLSLVEPHRKECKGLWLLILAQRVLQDNLKWIYCRSPASISVWIRRLLTFHRMP
jgi:hypothetical protein